MLDWYKARGVNDALMALQKGRKEYIDLSNLDLNYNDIAPLIHLLEINLESFKGLDLEWNNIGVDGARALSRALEKNTHLLNLGIEWNKIGPIGASFIAKGVKRNNSLTTLSMDSNEIGPEGALAISKALKKNRSILNIGIWDNFIDPMTMRSVERSVKRNNIRRKSINKLWKVVFIVSRLVAWKKRAIERLYHPDSLLVHTMGEEWERLARAVSCDDATVCLDEEPSVCLDEENEEDLDDGERKRRRFYSHEFYSTTLTTCG